MTINVKASITGSLSTTGDLSTVLATFASAVAEISYAQGSGAAEADKAFADTRTLAASTTEDLDLAGSMVGIDGLTFLNGVLYYNSVFFNNLYRVPVDAQGKAGTPVQIWMDAPVKGIDGMRVANGKTALNNNAKKRTVQANVFMRFYLVTVSALSREELS